MTELAPVAAFDFDGTLTTSDTFLPFLARAGGPASMMSSLSRGLLVWPRQGRDRAKEQSVAAALRNQPLERLQRLGRDQARMIVDQRQPKPWAPGIQPAVIGRLRRHQDLGHRVVVVSASLRVYVEPVARLLGVDDVIATELETDADDICNGRLASPNCRGPEKVARLEAAVAPRWEEAWAYGDSDGDAALLATAANAVWVRGGALHGPSPR